MLPQNDIEIHFFGKICMWEKNKRENYFLFLLFSTKFNFWKNAV
jgi:hypothetical protein